MKSSNQFFNSNPSHHTKRQAVSSLKMAILLLIFMLPYSAVIAQQDTKLNFTSKVRPLNNSPVLVELNQTSSLQYWDKDYVMIQVMVKVKNQKAATVRQLVKSERYKLAYEQDQFMLAVSIPNLRKQVQVNGREYQEEISYKVFAPQGTIVANLKDDTERPLAAAY